MRSTLTVATLALMLSVPHVPAAAQAPAPAAAAGGPTQMADADLALAQQAARAVRGYAQFTIFDDVSVEAKDGMVRLTGWVTAPLKSSDIAARVGRVRGVARVDNQIEVLPVSQHDASLRSRVARAIYTHSAFWHYASMASPPIHIIVVRGRVTLTGVVNNEVERRLAQSLANVDGAFSVTNQLRLDRDARSGS